MESDPLFFPQTFPLLNQVKPSQVDRTHMSQWLLTCFIVGGLCLGSYGWKIVWLLIQTLNSHSQSSHKNLFVYCTVDAGVQTSLSDSDGFWTRKDSDILQPYHLFWICCFDIQHLIRYTCTACMCIYIYKGTPIHWVTF